MRRGTKKTLLALSCIIAVYVFSKVLNHPWDGTETQTTPEQLDKLDRVTVEKADVSTNTSAKHDTIALEPARLATNDSTPQTINKLIIIAHQRVGSSFFGQLFDINPNVFYIYEPLDAVYSEMYGTADGWNVPSDITHYANGSVRVIPDFEQEAVREMLRLILECGDVPTSLLLHRYWFHLTTLFMPSWFYYRRCLDKHKSLQASERCYKQSALTQFCPNRFGIRPTRQLKCKDDKFKSTGNISKAFERYNTCQKGFRDMAQPCVDVYNQKCNSAKIRVVKTVRATVEEVAPLLDEYPDLKVIHLFRDPRPVVISRQEYTSYRGLYAGNITDKHAGDRVKESHIYCSTVLKDYLHMSRLQDKYPDRLMQVIYEDMVGRSEEVLREIYRFINQPVPQKIVTWVRNNSPKDKQEYMSKVNSWKKKMSVQEQDRIKSECEDFFSSVKYDWPY